MDVHKQISELERLAEALAVEISYEAMAGPVSRAGGLCRVKGRYRIIVDRRLRPPERVQCIADALRGFDIEDHFVAPEIRKLVAREVSRESA